MKNEWQIGAIKKLVVRGDLKMKVKEGTLNREDCKKGNGKLTSDNHERKIG